MENTLKTRCARCAVCGSLQFSQRKFADNVDGADLRGVLLVFVAEN